MRRLARLANVLTDRIVTLPVAFVHATEACNSRCFGCDYWKNGERELSVERARELARELDALGTELVVLTGGEPLFHPRWRELARAFARGGRSLWLLTSGLALSREASAVEAVFDRVTVSLDGPSASSYRRVRGVDAFDRVIEGISDLVARKRWVSLRTTVQKANFRDIPALIRLARDLGVAQISFFPADVTSRHAFGRAGEGPPSGLVLEGEELDELEQILAEVERSFPSEIASGLVAEDGAKLRRMHRYFEAVAGRGAFPSVACNAPRFSAVVDTDGGVHPCHFIAGAAGGSIDEALERARPVRRSIRRGERPECETCVCPMWRHPLQILRAGAVS